MSAMIAESLAISSTKPFGPSRQRKGQPNGFTYKLEHEDGTAAVPPILRTAVSAWKLGDTISLGRDRMLRVTEVRHAGQLDDDPVLVVEQV
jgi:hypothetical protein